jgi:hypothetical protein
MGLCGEAQQTKEILFRIYDNRQRNSAIVTVVMLFGDEELELPVTQVEPYLYAFGFSRNQRGVAILQVYVDGVQITESPVRVKVAARDCDTDFPGQRKVQVRRIYVKPQHPSF